MDYRNPQNAGQGYNLAQGYAVLGGEVGQANSKDSILAQKAYAAACEAQALGAPGTARNSESAMQRIVHQLEAMNNYSQRVSAVADRLVGSRPRDASAGSAQTAASNFTNKLHMLADAIARINADMADSAERLESFI